LTKLLTLTASEARSGSTSAIRRFGKYKREAGKVMRQVDVRLDKQLEAIRSAFLEWSRSDLPSIKEKISFQYRWYKSALAVISHRRVSPSRKGIELFSLQMEEFCEMPDFGAKAGMFLSALVNAGKGKRYLLHVGHLDRVSYLGYDNIKDVVVTGHGGNMFATGMKGGSLLLHGDAGDFAGWSMKGGKLTIKGSAKDYVGSHMSGGLIIIEGNAGNSLGDHLFGGRIVVKGDAGSEVGITEENHGFYTASTSEIFVRGKIGSITKGIPIYGRIYQGRKLVCDGVAINEFCMGFDEISDLYSSEQFERVFEKLRFRKGKAILEFPIQRGDGK
jgi:glutamate synthase domain-containing protein 3